MTKTSNFTLTKCFVVLVVCTIGLPIIAGWLVVVTGGHNSPIALHVSLFMRDFGFLIGHVWTLSILGAAVVAIWRYVGTPRNEVAKSLPIRCRRYFLCDPRHFQRA